ncbi:MAG: threonine/serine exporter family protein [Verrucomicrobiota bacterium]
MPLTSDPDVRTELCLKLGGLLFSGSASTQRTMDSVTRLYHYLGGTGKITVLVSYDAVIVSETNGDPRSNRISRFPSTFTANIKALMEISSFLRGLDRNNPTPDEVRQFLENTGSGKPVYRLHWQFLAAGTLGACYCAINSGDMLSLGISFLCTIVIFGLRKWLLGAGLNFYAATLLALITGISLAVLFSSSAAVATKSVAIVSPTLFLIPAVPLVLGGMDLLREHNGIGLARWATPLMMLLTIFLGLAVVMGIFSPGLERGTIAPADWPGFLAIVTVACATGSAMLAILFNSPPKCLPLFFLCGATTWGLRALIMHLGYSPEAGTFLGAVAATVIAILLSWRTHVDCVILAMLSVIPMVPGYITMRGARGIASMANLGGEISLADLSETSHFVLKALLIFTAIILAPIFTLLLLDRRSKRI